MLTRVISSVAVVLCVAISSAEAQHCLLAKANERTCLTYDWIAALGILDNASALARADTSSDLVERTFFAIKLRKDAIAQARSLIRPYGRSADTVVTRMANELLHALAFVSMYNDSTEANLR